MEMLTFKTSTYTSEYADRKILANIINSAAAKQRVRKHDGIIIASTPLAHAITTGPGPVSPGERSTTTMARQRCRWPAGSPAEVCAQSCPTAQQWPVSAAICSVVWALAAQNKMITLTHNNIESTRLLLLIATTLPEASAKAPDPKESGSMPSPPTHCCNSSKESRQYVADTALPPIPCWEATSSDCHPTCTDHRLAN